MLFHIVIFKKNRERIKTTPTLPATNQPLTLKIPVFPGCQAYLQCRCNFFSPPFLSFFYTFQDVIRDNTPTTGKSLTAHLFSANIHTSER